ncbi:hypothetical protein G9A89_001068 [Geosiphon pyriformis]|nr:hypothetical protein G9A89_001068 [Geosiphon pyriformis]
MPENECCNNWKDILTMNMKSGEWQKLKWFSDNDESIMPKCVHDTDADFDLKYPETDTIKLKPYSCICIDLKIALEILATTIVQLASRSSLVRKEINIRGGIIDAKYVGNIIAMLQNDSKIAYIIKPNEKIAQAIFLSLVKVAQLVLVENREELEITAREIQRFRSIGQAQMFEAKTTICKTREIGLTNFYILAKSPKHIKIIIYNTIEDVIEIPKRTIIRYLNTKVENQPPSTIPDFPQLCGYMQLKMVLNNFNDIFASKNEFGKTNIIQHQIKTRDAMPIKQ